jgi:hypothetical protein
MGIGVAAPRTTGRARVAVFAVVLALVAGVLGLRSIGASTAGAATAPQPTSTTSTTRPTSAVDAAAKEVQAFVERTRGLKFTRPVKVTLSDDLTFKARLLKYNQPTKAEVDRTTGKLRALGFVPAGFDLVKAQNDSAASGLVGFYDPLSKELVVRGGEVTPYVKEVMAHELTHALDDQHFGLMRPALFDTNDERLETFKALTEGDSVHVERAYRDAMSPADRAAAVAEVKARVAGRTPPVGAQAVPEALGMFGIYPYIFGEAFVDAVVKKHGQAGLDAAFVNPPVSSAQILVPFRYDRHMPGASARISAPEVDGKKPIIDRGTIGQFGLFVMLRQTMGDELAGLAADTWEGDTYVAWKDGDKTCVRVRFLTESAPSAYPLALVLKAWVDEQGGGTVEEPGTVLLTSCR